MGCERVGRGVRIEVFKALIEIFVTFKLYNVIGMTSNDGRILQISDKMN